MKLIIIIIDINELGIIQLDNLKENLWRAYNPEHFNEMLKLLEIFGIGVIYEKTSLLLPSMLDDRLIQIESIWPR
jgi:hypothetical protein